MKNQARLIGFAAMVLSAQFMGCKTDRNIQPTFQGNTNLQPLETYLSRVLGVSTSEIQVSQQNFIINGHTFNIKEVEANYAAANEYKLKYGITNSNNK